MYDAATAAVDKAISMVTSVESKPNSDTLSMIEAKEAMAKAKAVMERAVYEAKVGKSPTIRRNQPTLIGFHPHGIIPYNAGLMTLTREWMEAFPDVSNHMVSCDFDWGHASASKCKRTVLTTSCYFSHRPAALLDDRFLYTPAACDARPFTMAGHARGITRLDCACSQCA